MSGVEWCVCACVCTCVRAWRACVRVCVVIASYIVNLGTFHGLQDMLKPSCIEIELVALQVKSLIEPV